MNRNPDIARFARVMIRSYGSGALQVIEGRVAENSREGDVERSRFWWRVALAVRQMQPGLEGA